MQGRTVVAVCGTILLIALTGCQAQGLASVPGAVAAPTIAAPASTPNAAPVPAAASAIESDAKASGHELVWGAVSNCTCHEYIGTSSVEAAVNNARIGASVHELSETASDVFFYVSFDPKSTTRDQVVAAIKSGGGRLRGGPPTSLTD